MKFYKLLYLTVLSCFVFSCSQDMVENQTKDDSNERLAESQFDNSYLGVYKGLFSTNDGLTRGTVVINLAPNIEPTAVITLSTGAVVELNSANPKLTVANTVENLRFSSVESSQFSAYLNFSVEGNGANPSISAVNLDNQESNILIAKNLSRAPLTTITGTYMRTSGTGGFPTSGRTWNVMSIGEGTQTYATQIFYGGRLYNTPESGVQDNCSDDGVYETCNISGSATILGYDVTWSGTHTYSMGNAAADCSSVFGTWAAPGYGGSSGTFVSDSNCTPQPPANDTCATAEELACGVTVTGSTALATNNSSPAADDCSDTFFNGANNAGDLGVWFSFSTPVDQLITLDAGASDFDTQLRVFEGVCGSYTCVANNDDADAANSIFTSRVSFNAVAHVNYLIFLAGFANDTGDYGLELTCEEPPIPAVFSLTPECGSTLVDNGGDTDYELNTNDTYLIDAGEGNVVVLPFSVFNLENTWDFLQLFDGPTTNDPQFTNVNGQESFGLEGFTGSGAGPYSLEGQTVVSSGRYLTAVFKSDEIINSDGFYAIVGCVPSRTADTSRNSTSETFIPNNSNRIPKKHSRVSHQEILRMKMKGLNK